MKCPKCGTEVKDGMKFCMECGSAMPVGDKSTRWILIRSEISTGDMMHDVYIEKYARRTDAEQAFNEQLKKFEDDYGDYAMIAESQEDENKILAGVFGCGYSRAYCDGEYSTSKAWKVIEA